jgi:hypothetical protein
MSKFVGLGKGVKFIIQKAIGKKTSPTITKQKPKVGSLTERRKDQDDVIRNADKAIKKRNLTSEQMIGVKKTIEPGMKGIRKTRDKIDELKKLREKKMGGGMMGRRMGYSEGSNGKGKVPNKLKGFSKLPEKVQVKINKKLAKKV